MKIYLIGSGNVATVLGKCLLEKNHAITGVFSRNIKAAKLLAGQLNTVGTDDITSIPKDADVYLIAVSDASIAAIALQLSLGEKIVAHTAGAVSINLLKKSSKNFGVFYPLQSLRKEVEPSPEIPFLIDGNNEDTIFQLKELANTISSKVIEATDRERLHFHTAAVIVSNFPNFLYAITKEFLDEKSLDFLILTPLIKSVADRTLQYDPMKMQTGPAIRGDESTIRMHLDILKDNSQLQFIYFLLTEELKNFYNK